MKVFQREDAITAHCLQFSLLYNFGISYEKSPDKKSVAGIKNFFDFVSIFLWNIRPKTLSRGNGITIKKKPIPEKVQNLWDKISRQKRN